MIDIKLLRENFSITKKILESRNKKYPQLDDFTECDKKWRAAVARIQALNEEKNTLSAQISDLVSRKKMDEIEPIKRKVNGVKKELEQYQATADELNKKIKDILYSLPNLPDKDVPVGADENENVEIRKIGIPTKFTFTPKPHWDLGVDLNILDFERAAKISGARHTIFKNEGALLLRALRNFTLDMHSKAGYSEMQTPVIINPDILYGTGHLPKSKEDMFELTDGKFLSSTEEVPLTGYYNGEILDIKQLPVRMTCSSLSFRSEAGAAGKDTRGIIRQHQFYNTELVSLTHPNDSAKELEFMTKQAEKVLAALKLPYRVIILCTGDMGTAAVKTYDIEVWFPCNNKYREISSCSNCRDFQARGSQIKYRDPITKESYFVHTLNGTGTSLNRLWVAVVENYQNKDGSITIPDVLVKYMNGLKKIECKVAAKPSKVSKSKK